MPKISNKDFRALFDRERISKEEFFLLKKSDLKELGLPLGIRKRILNYIQQWNLIWSYEKRQNFKQEMLESEKRGSLIWKDQDEHTLTSFAAQRLSILTPLSHWTLLHSK